MYRYDECTSQVDRELYRSVCTAESAILNVQCTVYAEYSVQCVQYVQYYTPSVQCVKCSVYTVYTGHAVLHAQCTV